MVTPTGATQNVVPATVKPTALSGLYGPVAPAVPVGPKAPEIPAGDTGVPERSVAPETALLE